MIVTIEYPQFRERLAATPVEAGVARLQEFSQHLPLAPGDLVKIRGSTVTGVMRLTDDFIVEAYFALDVDQVELENKMTSWATATDVRLSSGCTVLVRSLSRQWIEDTIQKDPAVQFMDVVRVPTQVLSFEREVESA